LVFRCWEISSKGYPVKEMKYFWLGFVFQDRSIGLLFDRFCLIGVV